MYARGGVLPAEFLLAFQAQHQNVPIPPQGVDDRYTTPPEEPRLPIATFDITEGGRRKFSWLLSDWTKEDRLNKRRVDGTLIPLTTPVGEIREGGTVIDPDADLPAALLTVFDSLNDIHGETYYDAERYAFGSLPNNEYFFVPSNLAIPDCPIGDIGKGKGGFDPNIRIIAGVYSLAKQQAVAMKLSAADQIKWGALRLEAFKAGWFDHQKYTAYKPMPENSIGTFKGDGKAMLDACRDAWPLCNFLPYMAEFYFRSYGRAYSPTNASDYVAKAKKLAARANLSDKLTFLTHDLLFGKALTWIGVRRPMLALRNAEAFQRIPNVFKIRISSAPAGQAVITTSAAIIDSLISAHWWEEIARTGSYNEKVLMAVAGKIKASPWKYHIMAGSYGEEALTDDEKAEIEEARHAAQMFAPVLQAYNETVLVNHDLGRAQALKKYSTTNYALYLNALALFKQLRRQRTKDVGGL